MQPRPPMQFHIPFTPLTKKLLIGLLILYVLELILGQAFLPLSQFAWHADNQFQIWQPITAFFVLDVPPFSPIRFLLSMLGIVFFFCRPPNKAIEKKESLEFLHSLLV
jgi:hypothetical protein